MSSKHLVSSNEQNNFDNEERITKNLILAASMAVIGSTFQFGYNTGVINSPQPIIEQFYNQTFYNRYGNSVDGGLLSFLWGFTVAIFALGGMLGSLLGSWAANRFGLKLSMGLNNVFAIIAAVLMGFSKMAGSFEMLIIGRFLIGINSGINMVVAPMYLTEIAPVRYRGVFGTLGQFGVVTSILLSQILGLEWLLGTDESWPLLLGMTVIFSLYQLLVYRFIPESPRRLLLVRGDVSSAESSLQWLRGKDYNVTGELEKMNEEVKEVQGMEKKGFRDLFKLPRPLSIAVVMQLSQQFSGINAVFYYSGEIFQAVEILPPFTAVANVGIGIANVVMTIVSIVLIEKAGRRILHMLGLAGMFGSAVFLVVFLNLTSPASTWLTLVFIFFFVVFFQIGPGAIPWFITAEIFDQSLRPVAVGVAGLVNWIGNFTVALAYPPLESVLRGYTFIIFAVFLFGFFVFTYFYVPETKNRDIADIVRLLSSHKMQYSKSTKL